ncbi:Gfo/Idh/MocA family protein [Litorimonas sp. RW-G-Af-16]|uniref:Gfo/Idh/MocA family protein n=1 Tax=Litorimonas sp. RW-G-Af-16 TaxID=3241168 RepID=UPI00390C7B27
MKSRLKIGVVGAGVFGGYHANKCAAHPRTEFIGIFDPDLARAKAGAKTHDVTAFEKYEDMLVSVDAVVIACPARYHGQMAITALRAGKHCLIEKPIASTLHEAETIVSLADQNGCVVQVGHQERFVAKAIGLDTILETPAALTAARLGTFSERGTDVSVTLDLMTHDIDLVHMLMGKPSNRVSGESLCVKSDQPDAARAVLHYGATKARLQASRVEDGFTRVMTITYPSGILEIDFNAKTLRHNTPFNLNADFGNDPAAHDSLGAATHSFIESVLDGREVAVSAHDGLNALRAALIIDGNI